MPGYYSEKLSAERLRKCYELAPPRVQGYLKAEIEFVIERLKNTDQVLELGCGYGRVMEELAPHAAEVFGVDTSLESLRLAQDVLAPLPSCLLLQMDAARMGFRDHQFDLVVCVQNGISAFHEDQEQLIREAVRVTRSGGRALFSSYSDQFWSDRLEWFQIQSKHGLVGEIDYAASGSGVIVCKDGFKATTIGPQDFVVLTSSLVGTATRITEVDGSSIFCEIMVL